MNKWIGFAGLVASVCLQGCVTKTTPTTALNEKTVSTLLTQQAKPYLKGRYTVFFYRRQIAKDTIGGLLEKYDMCAATPKVTVVGPHYHYTMDGDLGCLYLSPGTYQVVVELNHKCFTPNRISMMLNVKQQRKYVEILTDGIYTNQKLSVYETNYAQAWPYLGMPGRSLTETYNYCHYSAY